MENNIKSEWTGVFQQLKPFEVSNIWFSVVFPKIIGDPPDSQIRFKSPKMSDLDKTVLYWSEFLRCAFSPFLKFYLFNVDKFTFWGGTLASQVMFKPNY